MRLLFILLVSLACADALAQARHRPDPGDESGDYYRSDEDWHERRRSLRAFREEMRQQEEAAAAQRQAQNRRRQFDSPDTQQGSRGSVQGQTQAQTSSRDSGRPHSDRRRLRRLSPEDRQRLREDMREVFRH